MDLDDTVLVEQLLGDEAPPVSFVYTTLTSLLFRWKRPDQQLDVEVDLERRAHWRYHNQATNEKWNYDQDADEGWPDQGKRLLMRFNRRAA